MGRVSQAQAPENRERVVRTASRLFRERGTHISVSVADLMKAPDAHREAVRAGRWCGLQTAPAAAAAGLAVGSSAFGLRGIENASAAATATAPAPTQSAGVSPSTNSAADP